MARATDQRTPKRKSRRNWQRRHDSPNVISDYDPIAEFERERDGRSRPDGSDVFSDYDPIAVFERERGGRLSTPQRAAPPKKHRKAKSAPVKVRRRGPKAEILPRLTAAMKDDIANQKLSLDELEAMSDKELARRYSAKRERVRAARESVINEPKNNYRQIPRKNN